jgi:hypothetical protein
MIGTVLNQIRQARALELRELTASPRRGAAAVLRHAGNLKGARALSQVIIGTVFTTRVFEHHYGDRLLLAGAVTARPTRFDAQSISFALPRDPT